MNLVVLVGNVGKDPVLRETENGTKVANFTLATTERSKDGDKTQWHNIVTFNALAKNCYEYLKKGRQVCVTGSKATRTYEKDGVVREITEIKAQNVEFLGKKNE